MTIKIDMPDAFRALFKPYRVKVFYGGRGAAKSWNMARAILILGLEKPLRVLCTREFQTSIHDSVHRLLADQVYELGFGDFYDIQRNAIYGRNGTSIIFKGLARNVQEIKSTEGINICWIEEAQTVSDYSYEVLLPTLRRPGSELWISLNPRFESDATYKLFIESPREDSLVMKVSWRDNPYFPEVLNQERLVLLKKDPIAYKHVWEGEFDSRYSGKVYAEFIAKLHIAGRITHVPEEKNSKVYTAWDLGYGDATSIWWFQVIHDEIRIIDFYQNRQQPLEHYFNLVQQRYSNYGGHYMPHDCVNKLLAAGGRSIYEQGIAAGLHNIQPRPAMEQRTQIAVARATLDRCWFDAEKCKEGLDSLKAYHFEWDEDRKVYDDKPLHDWSSHAADAFEVLSQSWREQPVPSINSGNSPNMPTFNQLVKMSKKNRISRERR